MATPSPVNPPIGTLPLRSISLPPGFPTPTFPSGFTCPPKTVCAYVTTVRHGHLDQQSIWRSTLIPLAISLAVAALILTVVIAASRRRH